MSKYWIRPIALCRAPHRDLIYFTYLRNLGKEFTSAGYTFYIEDIEGTKPKILVDAGMTADLLRSLGLPTYEDIQSVEEGLGKLGLTPDNIDIVILTHLHLEHAQLAWKYTRARFIVQKAELDFALNPHPLSLTARIGNFDKKLLNSLNLEVIEGDKEIVAGVRVMLTPGHSMGGQSVVIETPKGTAVIPGFCCTLDNFYPSPEVKAEGVEIIAPTRHYDVLQALDSTLRVKQSGDFIIPLHDSSFIDRDRFP